MKLKKLLAGLTSLACCAGMLSMMPATVSNAAEVVHNDFEVTYEGWHGTDTMVEVEAINGIGYNASRGMLVTARKTAEDGAEASKGLYLVGDVTYNYSIYVNADTDEVFHLTLTTDDMDTAESTVVELDSKAVAADEWAELGASFKAPKNSCEFRLTVTTESTNDFVFDELNVTTKEKARADAVFAATAQKGLKDEFAPYGFRVGNILNAGWGNGGTVANSAITANIIKDCNSIECENETKADSVLNKNACSGTNVGVSLNAASTIIDFCIKNNIGFRGHAFVWHSQTPVWFFKENYDANANWVSPAVMNQRLESYIKNTFELYQKQYPTLDLYAYDICNECVSDDSNRTANNGGAREPGDNNAQGGKSGYVAVYGDNSFIEKAFYYARQYAPASCKLYYNDYNEYWDHKRDCILNTIVKPLYQKGLLDGMGMQSHVPANATGFAGTDSYLQALDMYLSVGCDVQITELDISKESGKYSDQDQANKYKAIFQHAMDVNTSGKYNGKVTLVAIWGPNDANSWLKEGSDALLYDKSNQPKLAYTTLTSMIPESDWGDGSQVGGQVEQKPIEPDADGYWFHDTFEGSTCTWTGRGPASVETSGRTAYAGSEALLCSGREAEWNGATRELSSRVFKAGEEYSFSVNVTYMDGIADTNSYKLQLQYKDADGETQYDNIAKGATTQGQWVQLSNTNYKIPAGATDLQFYVETEDGNLNNFYIDEAIGAPAGTVIKGAGQTEIRIPIKGDINGDGVIDIFDVAMAKRGLLKGFASKVDEKCADVDESGTVDVADLVLLTKWVMHQITEFPVVEKPYEKVDLAKMQSIFSGVTANSSWKEDGENNPLYTQRFGADPGFMVYKDRLYVYTTNDAFEYKNGELQENSYDVTTINCCSSSDLVNWTDHGAIPVAGRNGQTNGAAKWAWCSWAPDACWKTINGKDKFFLYFANSGGGIGVLTADSPTGPWTDPLGHALLSGSSPNCSDVVWMFDPGVMVDDDGTGYLFFGGGVDGKDKSNPKTGRCVKLGDDMISLAGTPVTMETPYLFEDSSIIKIGDTYYYSYCANWNVPGNTAINGQSFNSADICYMTSKNPLGPWTSQQFGGMVFRNTGAQGLDKGGNNHHSIVYFKDKYYVLYHTRVVENRQNIAKNYRSPSISEATYSGGKLTCAGSHKGVAQLETLSPYTTVQAENMSNQSKGIAVNGLMDTTVTGKKGEWTKVSGVNFSKGAKAITVKACSKSGAAIKICAGSPKGDVLGYVEVPAGSTPQEVTFAMDSVSGTKDVYFVFSDELTFDSWSIVS